MGFNHSAQKKAKRGHSPDEFWYSLFICAENHETSLFGPGWVVPFIPFASNKNSTSNFVSEWVHWFLAWSASSLPSLNWLQALFGLFNLFIGVETNDSRLGDAINPSKAEP
jgi:hypothetical protein